MNIGNRTGKMDLKQLHVLLLEERPLQFLFAGDSLTHGCWHTGYRRSFTEYFENYIKTASPYREMRKDDIVINTGNSGATTVDMKTYFDAWIAIPCTDVAFLCFGMNDYGHDEITIEQFRQNLFHAVTFLRSNKVIPILQTPNNCDDKEKLLPYVNAVRDLANKEDILLVDLNLVWQENADHISRFMSDSAHPNAAGHLLWCRTLLRTLHMFDETSALAAINNNDFMETSYVRGEGTKPNKPSNETIALFHSVMHNESPVTMVFAGGRITQGLTEPITERNYVQHFTEVIRFEYAMSVSSMILRSKNMINTSRTGYGPKEILLKYEELIGRYHPQAVFLMPEFTEEDPNEFEQHFTTLVKKITESGAVVLLQTLNSACGHERMIQAVKNTAGKTRAALMHHNITYEYAATAKGQFEIAQDLCLLCETYE